MRADQTVRDHMQREPNPQPAQEAIEWRKSSHSGGANDCVEAAISRAGVRLHDSKRPTGVLAPFKAATMRTFVAAISHSEASSG
ncbi:hypothetical protein ABIA38_007390 [Embleya sp. AB8]